MDKKLIGYNSGFALYDKDGFIRPWRFIIIKKVSWN
jgi:hypothetical protein